jgi:hypothetical protein
VPESNCKPYVLFFRQRLKYFKLYFNCLATSG